MKIYKLSTVILCAAVCVSILTGCKEHKEAPPADNSAESTVSSALNDDTSSTVGELSENSSESAATSSNATASSSSAQTSSSPQSAPTQSDVHSSSSEHQHQYSLTRTVEPTCSETGYKLYTCSCGDQYAEKTDEPLGHSYTKSVVSPTCTNSGYTLNTCTRCGFEHIDDHTAALGHKYTSQTISATCDHNGYTLHTCERCGSEYRDGHKHSHGHQWGDWTITKNATAYAAGERRRICADCGKKETQSIPQIRDVSAYASDVVNIVNSERAKKGLAPLTVGNDLAQYAQLRSTELADNFEHKRPDGASPLDYVMSLGGIHTSGENIAYGQKTPEDVMNAWMNSPGHCANILNSDYTMIGVGCYEENGTLYWTQIFAG